jgi:hypothetical protein
MSGRPNGGQAVAPPLVIGALGGSGTRLIASILIESGYHLGDDLNPERDNLWFTLLFKRPRWYASRAEARPEEVHAGIRVLERAMIAGGPLDAAGGAFLRAAVADALFGRHGQARAHTKGWPLKQAFALWRAADAVRHAGRPWGWKEPNSHVYLPQLAEHYPGLRFVYVMRHGLDMAFSGNRQQLANWGALFGIGVPRNGAGEVGADHPAAREARPSGDDPVPRAMLDYWVKATGRAAAEGRHLLGERFLLLDYDALCTRPKEHIPGLLAFAGLDVRGADVDRLARLAEVPPTMGRYRGQDLSQFDPRALDAVRAFGFTIE